MQNLSDNDIDKLFKQAADQQQPQFDPSDWNDLEKRLDQPKRTPSYTNWTSTIVLLGALVWLSWNAVNSFESDSFTGIVQSSTEEKSTLLNQNSPLLLSRDTAAGNQLSSGVVSQGKNAQSKGYVNSNETEFHSNEKEGAASVRESESGINATSTKKLISESISRDNDSVTKKQVAKSESNNTKLDKEVVASKAGNYGGVVENSEISINNAADSQGSFIDSDSQSEQPNNLNTNKIIDTGSTVNDANSDEKILIGSSVNKAEQNNATSTAASNSRTGMLNDNSRKDSLALITQEVDEIKATKADIPADSLTKDSWLQRWAIKATISPDFSADQFKSVEKTGLNYGMMLEYFIYEKFSVSAGAIWSRKYYSAQDVSYGYYQADKVYGDCRMWDIPLNLTYYNSPSRQYSFFFTVGSSSYLMNEENYTYQVETGYGTVSYDKQVLKENNEWFKMLNLSVGIQKQFRKRWAVQVEPFIKVPLAGVGEGNIQLSSFGSFFSVRYKILDP